ncbi:hypothetical protein SAMN04488012_106135 [Palleronia salina]|uniref:Uncharacterized protein n=2 Tax=Palleronia TaxID=315422 RepID=A0A1M6HTF9_9RHOB|nr:MULTISPECIES: hypothetical protein [Palleronia]SEM75242.1 hypothetical protein SAMN04488011_101345 [Palleronia pelagia]SHJ25414.1 hypothetical protein SAMN04488012_106135 [Palleronia salina]
MSRWVTAGIALLGLTAFMAWDLAASEPPNIYRAPPLIALGSGAAASGAHCAALPSD